MSENKKIITAKIPEEIGYKPTEDNNKFLKKFDAVLDDLGCTD